MGKKTFFLFGVILCLFTGCAKKTKTYTKAEMERIVDSMIKERLAIIKKQAKTDSELRLPILIKPKMDSILHRSLVIPKPPTIETDDSFYTPVSDTNKIRTAHHSRH